MADTLFSVRQSVLAWLRGDYTASTDVPLLNEAINDALSKIWNKMITTQYERFMGTEGFSNPLTFVAPGGSERVVLSSIDTPTIPLITTTTPGGVILPNNRTFILTYSFVTESGSETGFAPPITVTVPAGQFLVILPPPQNPGQVTFGWNLYSCGLSGFSQNVCLQNIQPMPFFAPGLSNFQVVEIDTPLTPPYPPGTYIIAPFQDYGANVNGIAFDQTPPEDNTTGDNIAWIEHMEIQTSDTLFRAWNQMGLDSSLMRGYAATLSSASEYQRYAWDLINGNIIEFRPALGSSFTPRYWPIVKVRRLAYDQAQMPYMNINGVREFIVAEAVANLKLGVDEYIAYESWSKKAAATAMDVQMSLLMENWKKDTRVAPHLLG